MNRIQLIVIIIFIIIWLIISSFLFYTLKNLFNNEIKRMENEKVSIQLQLKNTQDTMKLIINEVTTLKLLDKIAYCESEYKTKSINFIPYKGKDIGLFQINTFYQGDRVKKLGLNLLNPVHNLFYATILYKEEGTNPWNSSKKCWGK